jgi:plasmid maintenance system antidote protein VapI
MDERERLVQWMKIKGLNAYALAKATGDTTSTVSMIVNGKRSVSDAFKWRFRKAFGDSEATKLFDARPIISSYAMEMQR